MSTTIIQPNELRVDLLASGGVNPWAQHDSSSRVQMLGGHLSQTLVIDGATPRRCQTGIEREFGRFTFSIKMPVDAEIIRVVSKYPPTVGKGSIRENPKSVIIYEDVETKEVGMLELPRYSSRHQHFGFRYKFKNTLGRLIPGMTIPKGTILADSPAIDDHGNYCMGVESNVAFMSVPGIIEDGVIVSKDYVQKLKSRGYETRATMWGTQWYPLNLYGNDEEYKPFPDIGDKIRDDGLLFALRKLDDMLAVVEMTPAALRQPDYTFDRLTYAEPNARVVDVNVRHEIKNGPPPTPVGMEGQTEKYYRAQCLFYETLLKIEAELRSRRKDSLRLSTELHRLLVEARTYRPDGSKNKAQQMYQRQPLDDWRVEVMYEFDVVPDVGYKLTDFHGGKGIICDVWETEDMPIDSEGNRAELIMDGDSTMKRTNFGRLYEQYYNATSRHVTNQVVGWMENPTAANIKMAWEYVLGYYEIISPKMFDLITSPRYTEQPRYHLERVQQAGVTLWLPTDNPAYSPDIVMGLKEKYPITIGPVTYRGRSGNVVTTVSNVLIGSMYIMLLEKTGGDWSGVSSAKLQHYGLPARLTKNDKHSLPARAQPVRILGESEVRLLAATVGGDTAAELLEMSNSPQTHKHAVEQLLLAPQPTNIKELIDRKVAPRGGSRALMYVGHALECAGIRFVHQPGVEAHPTIYPPEFNPLHEDVSSQMRRINPEDVIEETSEEDAEVLASEDESED